MDHRRLQLHFARAAAITTALGAMAAKVDAHVQYSGIVNVPIPHTFLGLYLNVVTGATGATGSSVPGWHINPWGQTDLAFWIGSSGSNHLQRVGGGAVANVSHCQMIGPSELYGGWSSANLPAMTTGNQSFQLNNSNNLYGFRFIYNGNTHYGWARISLGSNLATQPRYLVEFAYESWPDMPIYVGCQVQAGYCCLHGNCFFSSNQSCLLSGGTFVGNVSCSANPCAPPPPPCPADISPAGGNGVVDVGDLLAVISAWGSCPKPPPPCAADINQDGTVSVSDLLAVISAWGSCG